MAANVTERSSYKEVRRTPESGMSVMELDNCVAWREVFAEFLTSEDVEQPKPTSPPYVGAAFISAVPALDREAVRRRLRP
jgi:hypothetical protein